MSRKREKTRLSFNWDVHDWDAYFISAPWTLMFTSPLFILGMPWLWLVLGGFVIPLLIFLLSCFDET